MIERYFVIRKRGVIVNRGFAVIFSSGSGNLKSSGIYFGIKASSQSLSSFILDNYLDSVSLCSTF